MSDHKSVYMERTALMFLRAWPDVPESLRPVYSRFYDAGLLWIDPQAEPHQHWPGQLRLTANGEQLKEVVEGQSFNLFHFVQIAHLMPDGDLGEAARRIFKDEIPGGYNAKPFQQAPKGLRQALSDLADAFDLWEKLLP